MLPSRFAKCYLANFSCLSPTLCSYHFRQLSSSSKGVSSRTPEPSSTSTEPAFSGDIPVDKLIVKYCRSSGPGGQNVNKVATKVEMRFQVDKASWIPDWIRPRLLEKEKNRITKDGFLVIKSDKTRKQILNQADCLNRLRTMIYDAAIKPKEPTPEEIALQEKRRLKRAAVILQRKRFDSVKRSMRGSQ